MEMVPMRRSEALEEIGYDAEHSTLRVRFRNGGLYDYFMVPRSVYEALLSDMHPWSHHRDQVISHSHERLDG